MGVKNQLSFFLYGASLWAFSCESMRSAFKPEDEPSIHKRTSLLIHKRTSLLINKRTSLLVKTVHVYSFLHV